MWVYSKTFYLINSPEVIALWKLIFSYVNWFLFVFIF